MAGKAVPDDTVCTLSQLLGHIVTLVDDELLIEDLEDLAALEIGSRHGGTDSIRVDSKGK